MTAPTQSREPFQPLPHQIPPPGTDWDVWLTIAGRGSGKTRGAAEYVLQHLRDQGKRARVGIGAPSLVDVRDICAEGESGLLSIAPDEFVDYHRSIGYCEARHVGGGYVRFMGSESPARWNGPQWSLLWWDEWTLINRQSYRESQFGLRLGVWPRTLITATPKRHAIKALKEMVAREGVALSTAHTTDNPHLPERRQRELARDYGGTTIGRMELDAELVEESEGAAWEHEWIDDARVEEAPELMRIVVAVDPAATSKPGSDFTGIAVAGRSWEGEYYVLHAFGYRLSPPAWAARAIDLYDEFEADRVVGEVNNGGEMVTSNLATVPHAGYVPVESIHASRGKLVRAEPVISLYQQGRVHHVGVHSAAEDQMCAWPISAENDDILDAIVYAVTDLMNGPEPAGSFDPNRKPPPSIMRAAR